MRESLLDLLGIKKRQSKPRADGLTVVMDQNLGMNMATDLVYTVGEYIDFIKLGFGTWAMMSTDLIKNKIRLYKSHDIQVLPGGTTFEMAYLQKKVQEFFEYIKQLGFDAIEIPESSLDYAPTHKQSFIKQAKNLDFTVITEVGKKFPEEDEKLSIKDRIYLIKDDIEAGVEGVTIEARGSGKGVGIYDKNGLVKENLLDEIVSEVNYKDLIFEAPNKSQQVYLLKKFGQDVNLGNIKPYIDGVCALETMRQGARADTLGKWW